MSPGPLTRALSHPLALALAGVAHTASFAPLEWWWLQLLALAWLAWAVHQAPAVRRAFWCGWSFAAGWLASGLWWVFISMHQYGGMPAPLAAAAVALLAMLLAIYTGLGMALAARWRQASPLVAVASFAACWLLAELARGVWFTGFPWIASGYAHTSGPLAGWASWAGVYGIGALAAVLAAGAAVALRPGAAGLAARLRAPVLAAALVLGGAALLPQDFSRGTGQLRVSLLQTNVPQDLKFDLNRMQLTLDQLRAQLAAAQGALVVTPESAIPLPNLLREPQAFADFRSAVWTSPMGTAAAAGERGLLIGLFLGSEEQGWVNSLAGLTSKSRPDRFYHYGKRHLLPFGEFIPPGFGWLVSLMHIPIGDQARGSHTEPFVVAGQRLRPLVCYEDLFGEDIADSVLGPEGATVLVNASNLAWFGPWQMQDQHLQFSRMRALEFQRPVVRSTNTGATAVVDHAGRVTHRLPPLVQATLEASVQGRSGDTPYARWLAAAGLWPLWGLALLVLALVWRRRIER
jgi:apolipoprotein N-acyltransferase